MIKEVQLHHLTNELPYDDVLKSGCQTEGYCFMLKFYQDSSPTFNLKGIANSKFLKLLFNELY